MGRNGFTVAATVIAAGVVGCLALASPSSADPEPMVNAPPCDHTITGRRSDAEAASVHTLR